MKKLFAISIVALAAVLTLCACKPTVQPVSDGLTYAQILDLPKVINPAYDPIIFDSFLEEWNSSKAWNNDMAVVKCEVLSVDHYYWYDTDAEHMAGHTMAEVRVNEVVDDYNTAQIKPGQILQIRQNNYIGFETDEDSFAFFSEKLGKSISNIEELRAAGGGEFKLVPVEGVDYVYHMPENEYPLKAGESYTMYLSARYAEDGSVKYYRPGNIKPLNAKTSVTEFAKMHGFMYYPALLKISEEIAALFK
ncbi:MAG: hypothetical protein IKS90_02570 [Clostridia bacterium]|nr:hypothetical protein [Clostridia bacterium]